MRTLPRCIRVQVMQRRVCLRFVPSCTVTTVGSHAALRAKMDLAQGKKKKKDDKKEDKKKKAGDPVAAEEAAAVPRAQLNHTLGAEAGKQKPPYCSPSVDASISPGLHVDPVMTPAYGISICCRFLFLSLPSCKH